MKIRGLGVSIYRPDRLGDCTAGGVTSPEHAAGKYFIVFDEALGEGNWTLEECQDKPNVVCLKVVRRNLSRGPYVHLEPMFPPAGKKGPPMDGGNLAYTSDSRFVRISQYPLTIHDRYEW